jgi:hypothetical protein
VEQLAPRFVDAFIRHIDDTGCAARILLRACAGVRRIRPTAKAPMILAAENFQFARIIREYARWIAVDEEDRSPAPAWWWSPAFALRNTAEPLPHDWSTMLKLPGGATYAEAARLFLAAQAGQTFQPWPEEFPRRYRPLQPGDATLADTASSAA